MNESVDYNTAKMIMGSNFVGGDELSTLKLMKFAMRENIPEIPFSRDVLEQKKRDYLLILGVSTFADGSAVTIRNLQSIFGKDPEKMEPCFYNQDWYNNEKFIDISMPDGWFLIRKAAYEDSRAVQPKELMDKYIFPSALRCTYTFFTVWLTLGIKLWYHDYIWCSDTDHNGDRIYVGKYHDVDGINKNGFSIHRHLALRACYACID